MDYKSIYIYIYIYIYTYISTTLLQVTLYPVCPGGAPPGHPQCVLAALRQDIPIRELQAFHIYLSH
jgi:hypothetical protein